MAVHVEHAIKRTTGKAEKSKGQKMTQFIDEEYTSDDTCLAIEHNLANVKSIGKTVELQFKEQKDGKAKPLRCLLDTGTTYNIMSIYDLNKLVPNAQLRRSNTTLNFYDGSYMKPLGAFRLYMTHKQQTWKLQFEIVTTRVARRPLLNANTCERLGLISIHNTEQQKTLILQTTM